MELGDQQTPQTERHRGRGANVPQAGVYVSRTANTGRTWEREARATGDVRVRRLHELAREGRLAAVAAGAVGTSRAALTGAAYDVAWPIVFQRITRRVELNRGHGACAAGVDHLADDCLDRFHDDVEAVVDDLLAHARLPILDLEGWIAGRLTAATVDGHRRRRGERGALQRPRLPGWLAAALGHDRWLSGLATQMLTWVGVTHTAGSEVWPLDTWAQQRAAETGDWSGSDPAVVAREVETVLAAMRRKPDWYEAYVERPLGRKQAPVASRPEAEETPLPLADPDAPLDAEMRKLAADAVEAIGDRRGRGEQTQQIVVEVIRKVFSGPTTATLGRAPHELREVGGVTGALGDPATLRRIVKTVRGIIDEQPPARD